MAHTYYVCARILDISLQSLCCSLTNSSLAFWHFQLSLSYPSPSKYTCVSLHTGITRPMVHWSLQGCRITQDKKGSETQMLNRLFTELRSCALFGEQYCIYTNLFDVGKSMPSKMLSCLFPSVETTIRYLTLTGLTDSNCTACMTEPTDRRKDILCFTLNTCSFLGSFKLLNKPVWLRAV